MLYIYIITRVFKGTIEYSIYNIHSSVMSFLRVSPISYYNCPGY